MSRKPIQNKDVVKKIEEIKAEKAKNAAMPVKSNAVKPAAPVKEEKEASKADTKETKEEAKVEEAKTEQITAHLGKHLQNLMPYQ